MQEMKTNIVWRIDGDGHHAGDEDQYRVENRWGWSSCRR